MKYHIHDNKWTIIIEQVNTKNSDDIKMISELLKTNNLVVIKNQQLSIEEELVFIKSFSNVSALYKKDSEDYRALSVPETDGLLLKVGGQGFGEHVSEMAWHHDFHWQLEKKTPLLYLYAVSGTYGSKTSWINNRLAFNDLHNSTKDKLRSLKSILMKYQDFDISKFQNEDGWMCPVGTIVDNFLADVVINDELGRESLYFSFLQIHRFENMTREQSKKIIIPLSKHITQNKYCYHHEWEDGDIVICDNRFTLHKRWHFEQIKDRMLHRAIFDYIGKI
jgi:alpha-ketoglutarate-dependent taurine dioxygenase